MNNTDGTYHLSLCGPTAACSSGDDNDPTSVCLKKSQNPILKIGSYQHQKIIADGECKLSLVPRLPRSGTRIAGEPGNEVKCS